MSPLSKFLLGAASVTPLLSAVGLGCYIGYELIVDDLSRGSPMRDPISGIVDGPFDSSDLVVFAVLTVGIALLQLVLMALFAVHAAKDPRLGGASIVLWIAAFFLAGPFAFPAYFAAYVLREPTPKRDPNLAHAPIAA